MAIILIILCIFNVVTLCLAAYMLGRVTALQKNDLLFAHKTNTEEPANTQQTMSAEELARQKKRTEEELQALQELMNYNVNIAYGIRESEELADE